MEQVKIAKLYKQNLEERLVRHLAECLQTDLLTAMDLYYQSKLSEQIEAGEFGIENMDYKYLVEDMMENEPELFSYLR